MPEPYLRPHFSPLPLESDYRVNLLEPPVRLVLAAVAPGQVYWRLVRLKWLKEFERGNTLLYITTLDEQGQPAWGQQVIVENGGHIVLYTQPKPGEPYGANLPMNSTLNSYQAFVGSDLPSDRATGLGLGEWYGGLPYLLHPGVPEDSELTPKAIAVASETVTAPHCPAHGRSPPAQPIRSQCTRSTAGPGRGPSPAP